jgi:hypothetical protein
MKHLKSFNEGNLRKLTSYDIENKSRRKGNWNENIPSMTKQEYSGYMQHWRKVKSERSSDWDKHSRKSVEYQFAWKQKGTPEEGYPDFNYSSDAMICNLSVEPDWMESAGYDKSGKKTGKRVKFSEGKRYSTTMRFDSIDDDIMYDFRVTFDSFEEAEAFAKEVMKTFESLFKEAFKTNSSVYDATYDTIKQMFEEKGGYQN